MESATIKQLEEIRDEAWKYAKDDDGEHYMHRKAYEKIALSIDYLLLLLGRTKVL